MTEYALNQQDIAHEIGGSMDPRAIAMPRRWTRIPFVIDEKPYPCYYAPATNPHTIIGLCTGFKSSPIVLQNTVTKLNRMGFSVIGIALPNVGKECDFLDDYQKLVENFYFSPYSPLYEEQPELPRVALPHSLGGLLFQDEMQDIGKAVTAEMLLKGAIHVSPFLDVAGYSSRFNKLGSKLFSIYSYFNKDKSTPIPTGTAMRINLEPPTNGQVYAFSRRGDDVIKQAEVNLRNGLQPRLSQNFLLGALDSRACPRTTEYFANVVGGKVMILDTGHNPMTDEQCKGFEHVANTALNYAGIDETETPMSAFDASKDIEPIFPQAALA